MMHGTTNIKLKKMFYLIIKCFF